MRFFKTFKILHRRTKSEPVDIANSDIINHGYSSSVSGPLLVVPPSPVIQEIPTPTHPYLRILDLEAENHRLRELSESTFLELAEIRTQLKCTQADLYAELHRAACRHKEDSLRIQLLQIQLRHELFLQHVIDDNSNPNGVLNAHAHVSLMNKQSFEPASPRYRECPVSNRMTVGEDKICVIRDRTRQQYLSALELTLKARMQLRQCKKLAKFWKNTAKQDGNNSHIVTPSPSSISSIIEVLPTERQEALEKLIARRRAAQGPQSGQTNDDTNTSISVSDLASSAQSPASARPCLSPLASQSLRQELYQMSSTRPPSKWSYMSTLRRKPIGQIDLNVRSASRIVNKDKISVLSSISDPFVLVENLGSTLDRPTDLPRRTHQDLLVDMQPYTMGHIAEEGEPAYLLSYPNDISQEWVTCENHEEETSFGSTVETLIDASPSTLAPRSHLNKVDITKSRIPMPVFRSLKRISMTKLGTAAGKPRSPPTHISAKYRPRDLRAPASHRHDEMVEGVDVRGFRAHSNQSDW